MLYYMHDLYMIRLLCSSSGCDFEKRVIFLYTSFEKCVIVSCTSFEKHVIVRIQ